MSYSTWHNYGYGIYADEIGTVPVERLQALIHLAPKFEREVAAWLRECEIDKPKVCDYFEFDTDNHGGYATILQRVIKENENLELLYCDDFDGKDYLIFPPVYPWSMTENEKGVTEEQLLVIFTKYIAVLTDKPVTVNYQSVGNGG